VIVGDAFRDIALPAHLITDEFHRLVRARLRDDGFYVLNLIDAVSSRRLVASAIRTLRPHFGAIEIWYDTAAYQRSDHVNFIVYASSRPSGLASPLRSQSAPDTEWARMAPESLETVPGAILLTDDFAPVEHLLGHRPAAR
jgi:spermidine synthase